MADSLIRQKYENFSVKFNCHRATKNLRKKAASLHKLGFKNFALLAVQPLNVMPSLPKIKALLPKTNEHLRRLMYNSKTLTFPQPLQACSSYYKANSTSSDHEVNLHSSK